MPVLGIDFGEFGFLAQVPPTRWEARLSQVLRGRYLVREDATLRVVLERGGEVIAHLWAVQDVVFHGYVVPGGGQQMALLDLYLDGKYLNPIPGDGLIVATSPGSSAYNLAAGGSVLTPGSGIFSVTPICAHTPIRASFSIGQDTPITVVQSGRFPINVCVDGQESFDEFETHDVAHVTADDASLSAGDLPRRELLRPLSAALQLPDSARAQRLSVTPPALARRVHGIDAAHVARRRTRGDHRIDGLLDRHAHVDDGRPRVQRQRRAARLRARRDGSPTSPSNRAPAPAPESRAAASSEWL